MQDSTTMQGAGIGRAVFYLTAFCLSVCSAGLALSASEPSAATAASGSPAVGGPIASSSAPSIPHVSTKITDGMSPETLLSNAIALSAVGIDDTAVTKALSNTQARMDADATLSNEASRQSAAAGTAAAAALRSALAARGSLDSMAAAVRSAVLDLYTEGGGALPLALGAGSLALYAQDYAEATASPWGVLAEKKS